MTAVVARPNGKTYRARKQPSIRMYTDRDEYDCVVVLRTHDIQLAVELASNLIGELELNPTVAYTDWWRDVPWDDSGAYDQAWITDPVRGTPCVVIPHD